MPLGIIRQSKCFMAFSGQQESQHAVRKAQSEKLDDTQYDLVPTSEICTESVLIHDHVYISVILHRGQHQPYTVII